jgi:hypothetical protein
MPILVEAPLIETEELPEGFAEIEKPWFVFRYQPVTLFALKMSRATSAAGKTLLVPTPYAVKLAIVDAALRHGLTNEPENLIRSLTKAEVRIGVPQHACVTGTIQRIRQETRGTDRKANPELPPYRSNIAMREVVHFQGAMRIAINAPDLAPLLLATAPAINYFGKRGSFFQYTGHDRQTQLDSMFTQPVEGGGWPWGHAATLDDFGPNATFEALNSFSSAKIERGVHRKFVETMVPLAIFNSGPGFVHYCAPGAMV